MALDLPSYLLGKSKSSGGTSDYSQLTNKPSINGVTLTGNKTSEDLGISAGDTFYLGNTSDYTTDNRLDITDLPKGIYAIHYESYLYCKATINGTTYEFTLAPTPSDTPANAIAYLEITNPITEDYLPNKVIGTFRYFVVSESEAKIRTYGLTIRYEGTSINASSGSSQVINAVTTNGSQTISGKKTFSTLPESSVTPTTDYQLVNKKYVDDSIASAGGIDIYEITGGWSSSDWNTEDNINVFQQIFNRIQDNDWNFILIAHYGGRHSIVNLNYNSGTNQIYAPIYSFNENSASGDIRYLTGVSFYLTYNNRTQNITSVYKGVNTSLTSYSGYDATKTQVLKNINGTLTWITEE